MQSASTSRVRLTAPRINAVQCSDAKNPSFLWDTEAPTLAVKVTPQNSKSYVFESRLHGKTIRKKIGDVKTWSLDKAREQARHYSVLVDQGIDPRIVEKEQIEKAKAEAALASLSTTLAIDVWLEYIEERSDNWSTHYLNDHTRLARAGGQISTRGTRGRGVTNEGPLHSLLCLPLSKINAQTIEVWAKREGQIRPTSARLAWRLLKAFLSWCSESPKFASLVSHTGFASTRKTREALGKPQAKKDTLLREQLSVWFQSVREISNPSISTYLQVLLLIGSRPGELLPLMWKDVDFRWKKITLRDKVEDSREIPLTPLVEKLLKSLPQKGIYVFSGEGADTHISEPNHAHSKACARAGINGLTLHGLRRSFGSLHEWIEELPAGVVPQIQGHKPSATAEKHYRVRPLDLLAMYHAQIEAWYVKQANLDC